MLWDTVLLDTSITSNPVSQSIYLKSHIFVIYNKEKPYAGPNNALAVKTALEDGKGLYGLYLEDADGILEFNTGGCRGRF